MLIAAAIASLFPIYCLLIYLGERQDEKERKQRDEERYEKLLFLYLESGVCEKDLRKLMISEGRYGDLFRIAAIMEEYNEDRNRKQRSK